MIDYKNVYIEQITKLYDDYLSYSKNAKITRRNICI